MRAYLPTLSAILTFAAAAAAVAQPAVKPMADMPGMSMPRKRDASGEQAAPAEAA
jgi:hypothetical protein